MINTLTNHLLSRGLGNVTKWIHGKVSELGFKGVRDALFKGKKKVQQSSSNELTEKSVQKLHRTWRPQLQNYRTTLKENAFKIQQRMNYRSGQGGNKFFSKDLIWRRARNGHLIAFAGLFLFQEENLSSAKKVDVQYSIYERVCDNIKDMFPSYEESATSEQEVPVRHEIDHLTFKDSVQFMGSNFMSCDTEPNDSDATDEQSFVIVPDDSTDDLVLHMNIPLSAETCEPEFSLNVIQPRRGVTRDFTIYKDNEGVLMRCGRRQFEDHIGQDGNWPRKKFICHPNIVPVEKYYIDQLDNTSDKRQINGLPSGNFTNSPYPTKALYFVTRRYHMTLEEYLRQSRFDANTSCMIILQILEAVAHLEACNVVHRNISSDKIKLEFDSEGSPHVLLDDFDLCYVAPSQGDMLVPFFHETLDTRVQDMCFQAPEVSRATAGKRSYVDYRKSDAWSVGALAFEVLTGRNPFLSDFDDEGATLDSRFYRESDLPSLEAVEVSNVVKIVSKMLLATDPDKRLTAGEAADILHLEMFASPPVGDFTEDMICKELRSWIVDHCAEVFLRKAEDCVLYQLCRSFFARLNSGQLAQAFFLWLKMKV